MVQDAVAVIPDDSSVEIQEANKSSSAEVFEKLIDKMNAEISKAILGQTLTTEIGSNGSYAASNTHFAVRQDIIDSDKKLVEKTINQLLQWICEINFTNHEVPVFEMYQEEDVDLTLAQRDKIISECGVKFTKEYFIKAFGYEDEDFELIETSAPDSNFSQFKEEEKIEGQVQIDELFKFLSETELSTQAQKMLNPLISLLESCESFEEAKELLKDKNLKSTQFEQSLQKAIFLCELQGRSDGLEE
jgi:phage gp29-like protein